MRGVIRIPRRCERTSSSSDEEIAGILEITMGRGLALSYTCAKDASLRARPHPHTRRLALVAAGLGLNSSSPRIGCAISANEM